MKGRGEIHRVLQPSPDEDRETLLHNKKGAPGCYSGCETLSPLPVRETLYSENRP